MIGSRSTATRGSVIQVYSCLVEAARRGDKAVQPVE
jgi:hypothetical protein